MKNSNLFVLGMLLLGMIFLGFQCSSTELTSAKLYIDQKNYEKAIQMLQEEVAKNPKSDEGYFLLGGVYSRLDSVEEMMDAFSKSLAISNKFESQIEQLKYETWGDIMNKGLAYYNRSIKVNDDDSVKVLLEKAIPEFESATMIEPDSLLGYEFLAYSYLRNNRFESAIPPLKKLIELGDSKVGYEYLGKAYYKSGLDLKSQDKKTEAKEQFNKAIEVLSNGKKLYPEDEEIITTLFNAYVDAGRTEEALEEGKALVQKDPTNPVNHFNFGVILLGLNRYEESVNEFSKAIELDENYIDAKINLGTAYLKWGKAISDKADSEGVLTEDHIEKYRAALPYLEEAVEQPNATANQWYVLAGIYSTLGMKQDADKAFEKAQELDSQ